MKHFQQLMAAPTGVGLSDLMRTQQRLVDEMLFRTIELTALVEAGQHRFIGRALDDLERAEQRLSQTEVIRAAMAESIVSSPPGMEPTLSDVLDALDDETSTAILETAAEIRAGLDRIARIKRDSRSTVADHVARSRSALTAATSPTGLYSRR